MKAVTALGALALVLTLGACGETNDSTAGQDIDATGTTSADTDPGAVGGFDPEEGGITEPGEAAVGGVEANEERERER